MEKSLLTEHQPDSVTITEDFHKDLLQTRQESPLSGRQRYYGKIKGPLGPAHKEYFNWLTVEISKDPELSPYAFDIADTLTRLKIDSLELLAHDGFLSKPDFEALKDYKRFDIGNLVRSIRIQILGYQTSPLSPQISRILIGNVVSFRIFFELVQNGFPLAAAPSLANHLPDNLRDWWIETKPKIKGIESEEKRLAKIRDLMPGWTDNFWRTVALGLTAFVAGAGVLGYSGEAFAAGQTSQGGGPDLIAWAAGVVATAALLGALGWLVRKIRSPVLTKLRTLLSQIQNSYFYPQASKEEKISFVVYAVHYATILIGHNFYLMALPFLVLSATLGDEAAVSQVRIVYWVGMLITSIFAGYFTDRIALMKGLIWTNVIRAGIALMAAIAFVGFGFWSLPGFFAIVSFQTLFENINMTSAKKMENLFLKYLAQGDDARRNRLLTTMRMLNKIFGLAAAAVAGFAVSASAGVMGDEGKGAAIAGYGMYAITILAATTLAYLFVRQPKAPESRLPETRGPPEQEFDSFASPTSLPQPILPPTAISTAKESYVKTLIASLRTIGGGFVIIFYNKFLRRRILLSLAGSFFAGDALYKVFFPIYVKNVLHRDAAAAGILTSAQATGTLVGTGIMHRIGTSLPYRLVFNAAAVGNLIFWGISFINGGLIGIPTMAALPAIFFLMMLLSTPATVVLENLQQKILEENVNDDDLGKVRSAENTINLLINLLGVIAMGSALSYLSAQTALIAISLGFTSMAVLDWMAPRLLGLKDHTSDSQKTDTLKDKPAPSEPELEPEKIQPVAPGEYFALIPSDKISRFNNDGLLTYGNPIRLWSKLSNVEVMTASSNNLIARLKVDEEEASYTGTPDEGTALFHRPIDIAKMKILIKKDAGAKWVPAATTLRHGSLLSKARSQMLQAKAHQYQEGWENAVNGIATEIGILRVHTTKVGYKPKNGGQITSILKAIAQRIDPLIEFDPNKISESQEIGNKILGRLGHLLKLMNRSSSVLANYTEKLKSQKSWPHPLVLEQIENLLIAIAVEVGYEIPKFEAEVLNILEEAFEKFFESDHPSISFSSEAFDEAKAGRTQDRLVVAKRTKDEALVKTEELNLYASDWRHSDSEYFLVKTNVIFLKALDAYLSASGYQIIEIQKVSETWDINKAYFKKSKP